MKVAIDARELAGRPTGVGRYLYELLTEWAASPEATNHEWRLYAPARIEPPAPFEAAVRILPGRGGTGWEQWTLGRALARERPDVLFAPGYSAPLFAPCPVVLTIHDVSFAAHPEWFSRREGTRRRLVTTWSGLRARFVLTVSEFSREEVVRYLGVPTTRIRVIHHGLRIHPPSRRTRDPMVLFVGSLFRRRNVDKIVRAFIEQVAPHVPDARLEIVGENRGYAPDAPTQWLANAAPGVRNRVTFRSYVDAATLDQLYAAASTFVFPSHYEGFGMTPLEALAAGAVPIVLDSPVAVEIYGKAAKYVRDDDNLVAQLGGAMTELLTNDAARRDVLQHAEQTLARYRWDRAAAATFAALREAAHG